MDEVSAVPLPTGTVASNTHTLNLTEGSQTVQSDAPWKWVWAVSFMVWPLLAVGETIANCSAYWAEGTPRPFLPYLENRLFAFSYSALATPAIYWLALRFPFTRKNWARVGIVHLTAALLYSLGGLLFGYIFIPTRLLDNFWLTLTVRKFVGIAIYAFFNDTQSVYLVIVAIAHLMSYHRRYREREVRAAQLDTQLAQTQLQFLRSQLNPHFLFNTLQSISSLMEFDVKAADAMMAQLGDLLRAALDHMKNQETTLESELDFVSKYLNIEQHRLGSRLVVRFDIAEDTLEAQIPYLILQPLVENAVVHGISKIKAGGELRIQSRREKDHLTICVRNEVPSFERSQFPQDIGIGLGNTRERLKQTYGSNHTAVVRQVDRSTVEVCLRIPYRSTSAEGSQQ